MNLKDPSLALWPFGFGLSYTTFALSSLRAPASLRAAEEGAAARVSVVVRNTGAVAGDEVVFLYKNSTAAEGLWARGRGEPPPPSARRELIGFERVTLQPGEAATVSFNVTASALSSVSALGTRHVLPGEHALLVSRGHGEELSRPLRLAVDAPAGTSTWLARAIAAPPARVAASLMTPSRGNEVRARERPGGGGHRRSDADEEDCCAFSISRCAPENVTTSEPRNHTPSTRSTPQKPLARQRVRDVDMTRAAETRR